MFEDKVILITGGTGSFGHAFSKQILNTYRVRKLIIFSRDEYKQYNMSIKLRDHEKKFRFFL